jgi:hypothetical protein
LVSTFELTNALLLTGQPDYRIGGKGEVIRRSNSVPSCSPAITRQVGNSLRPSSTLRDFSRVSYSTSLRKISPARRGLQRLALSSNPPSVTVQRDRAAHSNANLLFTDPSKRYSCKGELDGADCFTFEEFGVGSEAEGF